MRVRWVVGGMVAATLGTHPATAQEGMLEELRLEWVSPSPSAAQSRAAPILAAGGLAGGAVGVVGGFYVGAVLASDDDDDDLDVLSGGVAGATIGEGLLLPLGVHIANGSRGSYRTSALASLGIAAAGLLALQAVHYDPPGATRDFDRDRSGHGLKQPARSAPSTRGSRRSASRSPSAGRTGSRTARRA